MSRYEVAEFSPRDVCEAAEARGEPPGEAMDRFNAECMAAIRADPEMHAGYLRGELMAAYSAENVPPSYEPAAVDAWLRAPAPGPSRTVELEAQLSAAQRRLEAAREDEDREVGS